MHNSKQNPEQSRKKNKPKISKPEKQQHKLAKVLALPLERQAKQLRNFWYDNIPKHLIPLLDENVIKEWKLLTNWQTRQDKPKLLLVSTYIVRSLDENQMKKAVQSMNDALIDPKSELKIGRDQIILDLLYDWMESDVVLKVSTEDRGYDSSTAAHPTGERPSLDLVPTLRVWLEMATGLTIATHIPGHGMSAQTWEEKAKSEIEELMDGFLWDAVEDFIDENDTESICEMRDMLYDFPACTIGEIGYEGGDGLNYGYSPYGYMGVISGKSVEGFVRTVDLSLLEQYPFLSSIHQRLTLETSTPPAQSDRLITRL